MRKLGILSTTIFLAILAGGLYGILNDEIAYTISPEYFTKYKFQQFNIDASRFDDMESSVAIVGFLATWWAGLIVGAIIGFTGMIYTQYDNMKVANAIAITMVFCTTVLFGFIGFAWGKFYLARKGVDWFIPEEVIDKNDFIVVGSIHNFSYVGAGIGILLGIIYLIRNKSILIRDAHNSGLKRQ